MALGYEMAKLQVEALVVESLQSKFPRMNIGPKKKPKEGDSSLGLSEGVRLGEAAFRLLSKSKSRKVGDP